MDKGDLFTVYLDGVQMMVCVVGVYREDLSGEDVVVLAVIDKDNLIHVPLAELNSVFSTTKYVN